MKKIVIVASTGGSVFLKSLQCYNKYLRSIYMVISDRECNAILGAKSLGITTKILHASSGDEFSLKLVDFFKSNPVDYFISFYTRIFTPPFLELYKNKVLNFHPSILPACPGKDGFGDTLRAGSKFIGSTVHFIDEGIDTGLPLIQAARPFDTTENIENIRHYVFTQQCKMFCQVITWINQGRLVGMNVNGASYSFSEFSPNLDDDIDSINIPSNHINPLNNFD